MNSKGPECWGSDANARALRVEVSPQCSHFLPYNQFLHAEWQQEADEHHLRIIFSTHEVLIRGQTLRRLAIALQRQELGHVSSFPGPNRLPSQESQPVILGVTVTELKNPDAAMPGQQAA